MVTDNDRPIRALLEAIEIAEAFDEQIAESDPYDGLCWNCREEACWNCGSPLD